MKLIIFLLVAFQVCNLTVFAFSEGLLESQRNERRLRLFGESKSTASEQSQKSEIDRTSGHFDFLSKFMSHKKKKQQGYEAASSYSGSQQSYGTPQQSYGSPQSSYGAPQPSHYATQQSYGTPQQSYGVPKKAPKQAYGAPQASYGVPQQSYGNPQQSYGAPQQSHDAPTQSYGAPSQEYGAPKKQKKQKKHKHKKEKGKKHKGGYGAPQEQQYGPPKPVQGTYGPPNHPKPAYTAPKPQNQYNQGPSQGYTSQQSSSYSQPQVPQVYRAPVRPSYVQAAVIIPSPPLQSNPYGTPSQEPAIVKQPALPNSASSSTGLIYGGALSPQISAVIKNYQNEKPALPSSSYPVGSQQVPNSFAQPGQSPSPIAPSSPQGNYNNDLNIIPSVGYETPGSQSDTHLPSLQQEFNSYGTASGFNSNNYAKGSGLPTNGFSSSSGLVEQQNHGIDTSQYKKPLSNSEQGPPSQPSSQYPLQGQPGQFPSNHDISSGSNNVFPENLQYNSAKLPYSSQQQDSNFGGFRDSLSPSSQISAQAQPEQFSSNYNFPSGSNTAISETSQFNSAKSPYSPQQQESNFGGFTDTHSFNSQFPPQEKPEQFSSNYNIPSGSNDGFSGTLQFNSANSPYSPQQQESDFGGFRDTPSPSSQFPPQAQNEQFESNYNTVSISNNGFSQGLQLNSDKSPYSSQQPESNFGGFRDTPSHSSQFPSQAQPEQFESSYNTLSGSNGFSESLQLNSAKSPYSSQQPESNFGTFEDTGSPISGVSNTFSEVSSFNGYNEERGQYQNPSEQYLEQQGQNGNQVSQQSIPYSQPQEFQGISQLFKNEQANNIVQAGQEQANSPYFQENQPINAGTPLKTPDSSRFSSYQSGAEAPLPQTTPPSVSTFVPYYREEQTTERISDEQIPTYTPVQPNPIQSSYLPPSPQNNQQTYGYIGNDQSIDGQGPKEGTYQGFGDSFGSLDSFFKDMPWAKEQDSGFGFFGRDFGQFQGQDSGQSVMASQGDQLNSNQFYDQSLNPTTEQLSTFGQAGIAQTEIQQQQFGLNDLSVQNNQQISQSSEAQPQGFQEQQFGVSDLSAQNIQQNSQSLDIQPQGFQEQQFGSFDNAAVGPSNSQPEANPALSNNKLQYKYEKRRTALKKRRTNRRPTVTDKSSL
ncbi:uncharacterized protein LOC136032210 isoform X2 [Artemia franciscana]|uniref:Uncharacterized protein n=1 Tax=Artemia franciscana TaxID=6661 RepID=A0AA88IC62_ARTSF|nr:hypothetical protein QYM36_000346 [Artemia franciscana]